MNKFKAYLDLSITQKKYKAIFRKFISFREKCTHLHPCLVASRKRESRDVQLYQIREKQMRRESEKEIDKMWHELAMKESEALVRLYLYRVFKLKERLAI